MGQSSIYEPSKTSPCYSDNKDHHIHIDLKSIQPMWYIITNDTKVIVMWATTCCRLSMNVHNEFLSWLISTAQCKRNAILLLACWGYVNFALNYQYIVKYQQYLASSLVQLKLIRYRKPLVFNYIIAGCTVVVVKEVFYQRKLEMVIFWQSENDLTMKNNSVSVTYHILLIHQLIRQRLSFRLYDTHPKFDD